MRSNASRGTLRIAVSLLMVLGIAVWSAKNARAQVAGATLTGTVTDSSGAIIPNAQVTITDVATGVSRVVSSNTTGLYAAPNLLPATYEVKVSASGFRTQVNKGIVLTVGAEQVLDVTLQVGQTSQTVEVTTEAPTVELTSSELGATVNSTTVRELPLNGRSWTDLAKLQPGVVAAESHAAVNVNRGYGDQVSIAGGRPQQNNYRLDGISINDYSNGGPGSVIGGNLGVDAIQEFSVLTGNYSAEYGKTSGGVVNAISRSGTNQLHGSLYEFLRNSALDSPGYFEGGKVPPFRRNQFGAAAGGPIRKDHLFVFGDYEGIRQSLGSVVVNNTLSDSARLGILKGQSVPAANTGANTACTNPAPSLPGGTAPGHYPSAQSTVCVDDKVAKYLPMFQPENAGNNGNQGTYNYVSQETVSENFFTTRVDEKISAQDSFFGTYVYDYSPLTQPDPLNNILQQSIAKRQIAAFEENHTFSPTFLNSLRLGYNREHANALSPVKVLNPVAGDASQAWATESIPIGPPRAQTSGLTSAPGLTPPTFSYVWNAYEVYDDAFVTRGRHALKFGASYERDQLNETTYTADFPGTFKFGSIQSLLQNSPGSVQGVVPGQTTPRYLRLSIIGAYAQDDWRFRPNLTLNLGLRWEMSTVPIETNGKLISFRNISDQYPVCGVQFPGCAGVGPYFSNPTLHNFEPRVGFSWDPFRNGKTAVRGGFGMFDVLPLLYTTVTLNGRGAPFFAIANATNTAKNKVGQLQGEFPGGASLLLGTNGLEYAYVEPHPHRNYVMQYNLNVQREIAPNLTAMIGYVGSRGVHQAFRTDDSRIIIPTLTSAGYVWPAANPTISNTTFNNTLNNTFTNVGDIRLLDWGGGSFYNAMQIGVVKKMSHGLQVQGSYTWGKSIDYNSGVIAGDTFANAISSPHYFDMRLNRGLSDYNIGRVLVISATWQLPTTKSAPAFVGWAANGWELGGILKINDGPPFSATWGTGGDPSESGTTDDFAFPNRLNTPGCQSLVRPGNPNNYVKGECFQVPTAPTPMFWNTYCDPAPPSLGYGFNPANPSDPNWTGNGIAANGLNGNPAPSWLLPYACFNLRGNSGRNIIPGPGLVNLDLSVFKNNPIRRISENFNVQFRAELFNVLNRANFALPVNPDNTDLFDQTGAPQFPDGSGGQIKSTLSPIGSAGRVVQFALKLLW